jgi:hypothetical protein
LQEARGCRDLTLIALHDDLLAGPLELSGGWV